MNIIIEKFRRVTRYGVAVFLASLSCFSAFADCTVTWSESNGGWWVDCYFGGSDRIFVPAEGGGGSGGGGSGGSCTNCTAMTPAQCEAAKSGILDSVSTVQVSVDSAFNKVEELQAQVSYLGQVFQGIADEIWMYEEVPQYLRSDLLSQAYSVNDLEWYVEDVKTPLNEINFELSTLSYLANSMNCSACAASGSGSGSDSGGGGTTPSGCPCSEFINGVKNAVDNCHTKLESINERLRQWDEIIKQINNDVHAIRQTTDRMDDFFKDDTEYNFKKLIEHTLKLSNAVVQVQLEMLPNLYWTEYTNATQFLDDSGSTINWLQKGKTIEAGANGAVIDFGEYQGLNWFQRMEFLLGHIAGIFSPTNSTSADFSSEEKEKAEDAQDAFDGLTFDDEKSVLQQMVQYVENIEDSLNPFHGLFDYSSGSARSITFLPDVSVENGLLQNTMPTITMDLTETGDGSFSISDLVDLAHGLTTFLWYVSFLIIDVLAIIKFVQCLIALNRWYWKIYNSWVSTMFSGGGR